MSVGLEEARVEISDTKTKAEAGARARSNSQDSQHSEMTMTSEIGEAFDIQERFASDLHQVQAGHGELKEKFEAQAAREKKRYAEVEAMMRAMSAQLQTLSQENAELRRREAAQQTAAAAAEATLAQIQQTIATLRQEQQESRTRHAAEQEARTQVIEDSQSTNNAQTTPETLLAIAKRTRLATDLQNIAAHEKRSAATDTEVIKNIYAGPQALEIVAAHTTATSDLAGIVAHRNHSETTDKAVVKNSRTLVEDLGRIAGRTREPEALISIARHPNATLQLLDQITTNTTGAFTTVVGSVVKEIRATAKMLLLALEADAPQGSARIGLAARMLAIQDSTKKIQEMRRVRDQDKLTTNPKFLSAFEKVKNEAARDLPFAAQRCRAGIGTKEDAVACGTSRDYGSALFEGQNNIFQPFWGVD